MQLKELIRYLLNSHRNQCLQVKTAEVSAVLIANSIATSLYRPLSSKKAFESNQSFYWWRSGSKYYLTFYRSLIYSEFKNNFE